MSEPTVFEQSQQLAAAFGGMAYIDEVLIRGKPDGTISGAHLVIGIQAPGMTPVLQGPLPLDVIDESAEWQAIAAILNVAALDQVAELQQQLTDRDVQISNLQQQLADLQPEGGE